MNITITKRFEFSYAHLLPNHSGKCKRLHGHNAVLEVTVSGEPHGAETYEGVRPSRSDEGMVIDFGDLKQIVKDVVVDKWDHRFLAKGDEWPYRLWIEDNGTVDLSNFEIVAVRTTAENLVKLAFELIVAGLPEGVYLEEVRFYETPDSVAIYGKDKL